MRIDVRHNMDRLASEVKLEQRQMAVAAARALNVMARGLRTDAGRVLRERYPSLKLRDIQGLFSITLATPQSLTATVQVRGRPLSLIRFLAGNRPGLGGGVLVAVKGGGTKMVAHAFVARGRDFGGASRSEVIFTRHQYAPRAKRYPSGLVALRTIDIPGAMHIKEVAEVLSELGHARFDKEYLRQANVLTR